MLMKTGTSSLGKLIIYNSLFAIFMMCICQNKIKMNFIVYRVSFMEVYNEKVRDLLNIEKSDLKVYETVEGNIATDCTVDMVSSPDEMVQLMDQGNKNKSIGETQMNERSSRSHTIFRIVSLFFLIIIF